MFISRISNIGIIDSITALKLSLSGPVARAAGVAIDMRAYAVDFTIPLGTIGDSLDRYLVRLEEILASVVIIRSLLSIVVESIGTSASNSYHTMESMIATFKGASEGSSLGVAKYSVRFYA